MATLIVVSLIRVTGVLASAFIAAVNLLDFAKGRSLNTCDRILVALGISSSLFQVIALGEHLISKLWHEVYEVYYVYLVFMQLQLWTVFSSVWLTACLCLFYCVRIADFNHSVFIWLKRRISEVVHWLILGSVAGSLLLSIPIYGYAYTDCCRNQTNQTNNLTSLPIDAEPHAPNYMTMECILGFFFPLVLSAGSITPILISLCRHTRKMKLNEPGFSQPRMDAHFGATKMVGCLLLIYSVLFINQLLVNLFSFFTSFNYHSWIIISSCVTAQSIVLILGNTKLRRMFWKVFLAWRK